MWPRPGHVRPDWLRFLMKDDLERRPPPSDDVASGLRGVEGWHGPHGRGRREAAAHEQWGRVKGSVCTHYETGAMLLFPCQALFGRFVIVKHSLSPS